VGVIAEMIVNVTARTEKFREGINDSQKALGAMGGAAGRFGGQIQKLVSGPLAGWAAGTASITGALYSMKRQVETVIDITRQMAGEWDKTIKTAQKLGASANAFAALSYAGERVGVGSDKLATSLQRLTRKIGDAQRGGAEASMIFRQLGLNVDQLSLMTADQQFIAVSQAIAGLRTHTERLSATVKIFDSEGADLVRMLSLGSAGFAQIRAEAQLLGLTVSDDTAASFVELQDAITRLSAAIKGLKTDLASTFSNAVVSSVDALTASLMAARGAWLGTRVNPLTNAPTQLGRLSGWSIGRWLAAIGLGGTGRGGRQTTQEPDFPPGPGVLPDWMDVSTTGGWTNRSRLFTGAAGRAAGLLAAIGNAPNRFFGGLMMGNIGREVKSWRSIISGFARPVDRGGAGFNQAIAADSIEAQMARARARSGEDRVQKDQLAAQNKMVALLQALRDAAAAAGRPIIEEVTL